MLGVDFYSGIQDTYFSAKPSQLLDGNLFDFKRIKAGDVVDEGDVAFDE
jgi:hypothetical protein